MFNRKRIRLPNIFLISIKSLVKVHYFAYLYYKLKNLSFPNGNKFKINTFAYALAPLFINTQRLPKIFLSILKSNLPLYIPVFSVAAPLRVRRSVLRRAKLVARAAKRALHPGAPWSVTGRRKRACARGDRSYFEPV